MDCWLIREKCKCLVVSHNVKQRAINHFFMFLLTILANMQVAANGSNLNSVRPFAGRNRAKVPIGIPTSVEWIFRRSKAEKIPCEWAIKNAKLLRKMQVDCIKCQLKTVRKVKREKLDLEIIIKKKKLCLSSNDSQQIRINYNHASALA